MTQRLDATHFCEVWKSSTTDNEHITMNEIDYLQYCLNATIRLGSKTIAVWKIKEDIKPTNWKDKFKTN